MPGTNAAKCAATVGGVLATRLRGVVAATIQLSKSNSGSLATDAPSGIAVTHSVELRSCGTLRGKRSLRKTRSGQAG